MHHVAIRPSRTRLPLLLAMFALAAAPLQAQQRAEPSRATLPPPSLIAGPMVATVPAGRPWMRALEQARMDEVTRPRWVLPVAGAVIGGAAGPGLGGVAESSSDYMGPVRLMYITGTLGSAAGALAEWYADAAQRQWIATHPTRDER